MAEIGLIGILIIILNFIISYKGFNDFNFFEKYKFEVDKVLINRETLRLISSAFLHVSWTHLIFNMISLYAFCGLIERYIGEVSFLIIYISSILGGKALVLLIHRFHGDYSSVGASGGVVGVIFASIALFPGLEIGLFGIPASIPSWIYGLLYVLYSIYGIKSGKDNIGHEAHLGGGLVGLVIALIIKPEAIYSNYIPILSVLIPSVVFIYLIITRPQILLVDNLFFKQHENYFDVDHKYNDIRHKKQVEIDKLLDKIGKKGIESLSKKEKQKLEEYSK